MVDGGVGGEVAAGGVDVVGEEVGEVGGGGGGQADEGDVFAGVDGQVQAGQDGAPVVGEGHVVEVHERPGLGPFCGGAVVELATVGEPHGCPFFRWVRR